MQYWGMTLSSKNNLISIFCDLIIYPLFCGENQSANEVLVFSGYYSVLELPQNDFDQSGLFSMETIKKMLTSL